MTPFGTPFGLAWSIGALWLAAALLLAIAEMLAPGFFLVFLGVGAGVTGVVALLLPLPIVAQALLFAVFSAGAMVLGRRWYRRSGLTSPDPLLNDRTARLIGKQVEVCDAIVGGAGRVKVGDGAWNATGPDAAVGVAVRIVGAAGGVLRVEPA